MRSIENKNYYTHPTLICQLFSAFFSIFFSDEHPNSKCAPKRDKFRGAAQKKKRRHPIAVIRPERQGI